MNRKKPQPFRASIVQVGDDGRISVQSQTRHDTKEEAERWLSQMTRLLVRSHTCIEQRTSRGWAMVG